MAEMVPGLLLEEEWAVFFLREGFPAITASTALAAICRMAGVKVVPTGKWASGLEEGTDVLLVAGGRPMLLQVKSSAHGAADFLGRLDHATGFISVAVGMPPKGLLAKLVIAGLVEKGLWLVGCEAKSPEAPRAIRLAKSRRADLLPAVLPIWALLATGNLSVDGEAAKPFIDRLRKASAEMQKSLARQEARRARYAPA